MPAGNDFASGHRLTERSQMMRHPHITGFVGYSGSGKTTLIVSLISEYMKRGRSVGVVKHTHHESEELSAKGGDAERFVTAGAEQVVLVSDRSLVRWVSGRRSETVSPIPTAAEIVASLTTDVVLVEGFKSHRSWPRIAVWRPGVELPPLDGSIEAVVAPAGLSTALRRFSPEDVPELADFLDTIAQDPPS